MGVYGYPRYTGDIDFWVESTEENAINLVKVFEGFGLKSFGLTIDDFIKPEQIIQIGHPPFRIDVLTSIDGVNFEEAYPNRKIVRIDDIPVNFIGLDDLKKNKKASGRGKDLNDLENLEK